jgi:cation:H+ antiporter
MEDLSTTVLLLIFGGAALATWAAGVRLARATDVLDDHFGLGEAIGGMILLSVVDNLPEVAITVSAAVSGNLGMAAGNLIGGVAMQTLVLVIADRCIRGSRPLSASTGSLVPALEGLLVIAVVGVAAMSGLLPTSAAIGPLGVGSIFILAIWIVGITVLSKVRTRGDLALAVPAGADAPVEPPTTGGPAPSVGGAIATFLIGAGITLFAGVLLERTGNELASKWGINGVLFGATILAAATALPEISTGITGVRLQRYTLVFGDMFGGNAFQLTLFVIADICAGGAVLPHEGAANAWIAVTGLVMTTVYVTGIILRPSRRHFGLGADSWVVLLVYLLGLWGFVVVSQFA